MAKTYDQIQRQIAALTAEAEAIRQKEVGEVIGRIREAITHYRLTAADLGFDTGAAPKAAKPGRNPSGRKAGPKADKAASRGASGALYRDETGRTWAGRGKRPQWLRDALAAGRKLEDFKVPPT